MYRRLIDYYTVSIGRGGSWFNSRQFAVGSRQIVAILKIN